MGPDEDKKLRQLLRMSKQLPEPDWNLFARTTKRFSSAAPSRMGIERQAREEIQKESSAKKAEVRRQDAKKARVLEKEYKENREKAAELSRQEDFEAREAIFKATKAGSAERRKALFDLQQTVQKRKSAEKELDKEHENFIKRLIKK